MSQQSQTEKLAVSQAGSVAMASSGSLPSVGDFFELLKPRVMSLVIFTGFVGMYLASGSLHPALSAISLLAIAAGAGASGAINQWYDRDVDAVMSRTQNRPIPSGRVEPSEALALGVIISVLSVLVLSLASNFLAGGLLAFTIFFYAVVYSVWLKRSTPQNIVIGGAAGALPPVVGWAAVTGEISVDALILFALIFIWTPPHFWALALVKNDDYRKAGIPMLPVIVGRAKTISQMYLYSAVLAVLGMMPSITGLLSPVYGGFAALMGGIFLVRMHRLKRSGSDDDALSLFTFSILYLFALFAGMLVDKMASDFGYLAMAQNLMTSSL